MDRHHKVSVFKRNAQVWSEISLRVESYENRNKDQTQIKRVYRKTTPGMYVNVYNKEYCGELTVYTFRAFSKRKRNKTFRHWKKT